jgi:hypothetical protein
MVNPIRALIRQGESNMNWDAFAAIAQAVETVAVVIALFYAWQQVRAARKELRLGAVWEIFRELDSAPTRAARGYIYKNRELYKALTGQETALAKLPNEAWRHAEAVSNAFDRIGYVVHQGLLPENLITDGYYHIIARSWIVLEPFIEAVRKSRNQENYQPYFEYLAMRVFDRYMSRDEVVISQEPRGMPEKSESKATSARWADKLLRWGLRWFYRMRQRRVREELSALVGQDSD